MNFRTICGIAGVALLATGFGPAQAQTPWPEKTVRIVVPHAAGGTTDFAARQVAQKLTEQLGQSFIVENRSGAGSTIGTQVVTNAAPDGYTLLTLDTAYSMLPALIAKLPWDHANALVPVTTLLRAPVVLAVPSGSRFKTLQDVVGYARQNPGKLNYGSGGTGSSAHFQFALFLNEAGIDITHIPYKGAGEAMMAAASGQVDVVIAASPTAIAQVRGGKVRALAVSGEARLDALTDVPTFGEAGFPNYTVVNWFGMAAPRGTDPQIIDKLNAEIRKALADPGVRERFAMQGAQATMSSPAEFSDLIRKETEIWRQAARSAGIQQQ